MSENAGPPAGWYPVSPGVQRYWNGGEWTPHVTPLEQPRQAGPSFGVITAAIVVGVGAVVGAVWFLWYMFDAQNKTDCHLENLDRAIEGQSTETCD